MSRADDLAEAQREVDAMLPGTPRIAPSSPPAILGCIEVPADAPLFRSRFIWNDGAFVLSLVFTIVCFVRAIVIYEARARDGRSAIERVQSEILRSRQDSDEAMTSLRADELRARVGRLSDEVDALVERQRATKKPRGRR